MSNEFIVKGITKAKLPSDYGSTGFKMFKGSILNSVEVAYETWGKLSVNNDNVILLFTGLSPSSHAASSDKNNEKGWFVLKLNISNIINQHEHTAHLSS